MEPRHSTSSPLPSQAILIIGVLGFVCLLLAALLVVQFVPAGADSEASPLLAASSDDAPDETDALPLALSDADLESLHDAYDEPVLAELLALLDAVHVSLDERGGVLPASVQPYLDDLTARMNTERRPYRVTLYAPTYDLAERRAERIQAIFLSAGLSSDLLTFTGQTGSDGVVVEQS